MTTPSAHRKLTIEVKTFQPPATSKLYEVNLVGVHTVTHMTDEELREFLRKHQCTQVAQQLDPPHALAGTWQTSSDLAGTIFEDDVTLLESQTFRLTFELRGSITVRDRTLQEAVNRLYGLLRDDLYPSFENAFISDFDLDIHRVRHHGEMCFEREGKVMPTAFTVGT